MGADGQHLKLTLWDGEQVGTFKDGNRSAATNAKHPKYRRESFIKKEVYIPYKNELEKADESMISNHSVGKNLAELKSSVDSLDQRIDSINNVYSRQLVQRTYFKNVRDDIRNDSTFFATVATPTFKGMNLDSIYRSLQPVQMQKIINSARSHCNNVTQSFSARTEMQATEYKTRSMHEIDIHRKFVLSIGCLIFFFIGAPLGAIIRKGGLGIPIITSVAFFIVYYVIDNSGIKLAKNGEWEPWAGVWLSSMVLAPIGIFLTWRAINDSVLFDWDSYKIFFTKAIKQSLVYMRKIHLLRPHKKLTA